MSGRYHRGYGSCSKKIAPSFDIYGNQLLRMLKKEMEKVDKSNAKRLDAYRNNSKNMSDKHAQLLRDVQSNLTKFKGDYDTIKKNFHAERETTSGLKKELAESLSERQTLQSRYDELLQNYGKQKEKIEKKQKESANASNKKRKLAQFELLIIKSK